MSANQELYSVYRDKRIAIVGGADDKVSPIPADTDLVVQINNHWCNNDARADIVYSAGTQPPLLSQKTQVVILIKPMTLPDDMGWREAAEAFGAKFYWFDNNRYLGANPRGPEHDWLNRLGCELHSIPLTGIAAIAHIVKFPVASIFLTGFTFYMDKDGSVPELRDSHKILAHVEWLQKLARRDERIACCPHTTHALGLGNYY